MRIANISTISLSMKTDIALALGIRGVEAHTVRYVFRVDACAVRSLESVQSFAAAVVACVGSEGGRFVQGDGVASL